MSTTLDLHSHSEASEDSRAPLEAYLNWLNEHDEAYQEYLAWKYTGLSPSFQTLVTSVRGEPLCRLCEHLRRAAQLDQT